MFSVGNIVLHGSPGVMENLQKFLSDYRKNCFLWLTVTASEIKVSAKGKWPIAFTCHKSFSFKCLSPNSNLKLDANVYGSSLLWRMFLSICLILVITVAFRVWVLEFHQLLRKCKVSLGAVPYHFICRSSRPL